MAAKLADGRRAHLGAVWLVKVIDQALFYRAIYILMFLIGLHLIGQAGADLI